MTDNLQEQIIINRIVVGDYTITHQSHGSYWIQHISGEGMEILPKKLEKLIRVFTTTNSRRTK